jgi:predicted nucleic acid-binding protein
MTVGIVDTTVIIHLFRRNKAAESWLQGLTSRLSITPMTWMEVIYGAPGKSGQAACLALMSRFEMVYPTSTDMDWAMQSLHKYRLSHGVTILDCLIASVAYREQVPLYTDNVKDFQPILPASLITKPY